MPAPISRPVRDRLRDLHEAGWRIIDIAAELGLSRTTVSKYVRKLDAGHALKDTPAARLDEFEVGMLSDLACQVVVVGCGKCGAGIIKCSDWERWTCSQCGRRWRRRAA